MKATEIELGKTSICFRLCASVFALGQFTAVAIAQDAPERDSWKFTVAPYLWGASLSGTAATIPGLPPVDVDASFSDILDNLSFAGMIVGNAQKGRWGVTADLQYISLKNSTSDLQPLFNNATVRAKNKIFSVLGEYKMVEAPTGELWASAGARYWSVDTSLDLAAGDLPTASANGNDSWVDPVIGLRGRMDIADRKYLTGWAYAGGFGVGSEIMADIFGGVGYKFTPMTSGVLGYRLLMVDRRSGDFTYDVEQKGLMAGLSFQF
ncbi:hypothetical protein C1J05_11410 [Sulfitobacter sp. JL08]|uniref:hypothetical protein n=1 Tax=Sulfitobacter sp. JL08 TaxID=2070369 RepID=UPI000E0A08ED|nr:hypothetical protein [Sulfitobacter sp. JL08]AXI55019.1 hypothetical protein C1J05_11410 [Sulfitobacter sp. JL08]